MRLGSWFPLSAWAAAAAVLMTAAAAAPAAVTTREVKYAVGGTEYVGFLAYDDAAAAGGKQPGVLIAPEWVGVNDYARGRARQLAGMGYVAFVFDPYGGGKNAADAKQSAEWSGALKNDRPELRRRVTAAFDTLKKQPQVDPARTAAIGYCFGGTTVLELARSGADVLGVVSFHGGLSTTMPAKPGELKAKVLVCHGAIDPFVPPAEVAAFQKEMQDANADWQLIAYGDSVHSFTNPDASKRGMEGVAYNEKADRRSWRAMKGFFTELFGVEPLPELSGVFPDLFHGDQRRGEALPSFDAPRGDPVGPRGTMFGDGGTARTVVFVCDATGTMINKLGSVRQQLVEAIKNLKPIQEYNVIFFSDSGKYHIADKNGLIVARPDNKRKTYDFLDEITPVGQTDPIPALEAAFRQQPQLVYFLADGEFANLKSYKEVTDAINRFNKDKKVKVNTILFETFDKEADKVMKRIAADNGGSYRYVREADLQ